MRWAGLVLMALVCAIGISAQEPLAPQTSPAPPQTNSPDVLKLRQDFDALEGSIDRRLEESWKRQDDRLKEMESQIFQRYEKEVDHWNKMVGESTDNAKWFAGYAIPFIAAIFTVFSIVVAMVSIIISIITYGYGKIISELNNKSNDVSEKYKIIDKVIDEIDTKIKYIEDRVEIAKRHAESSEQSAKKAEKFAQLNDVKDSKNKYSILNNFTKIPNEYEALFRAIKNNHHSEVASISEKILKNNKNDKVVLLTKAESLYHIAIKESDKDKRKKELQNAIDAFEKAIKNLPDIALNYFRLGVLYSEKFLVNDEIYDIHDIDKAIFNYKKAIDIKDDFPEAHHNYGNALLGKSMVSNDENEKKQYYEDAKNEYQIAESYAPGIARIMLAVSEALFNNKTKCREWIEAAKEKDVIKSKFDLNKPAFNIVKDEQWFKDIYDSLPDESSVQ